MEIFRGGGFGIRTELKSGLCLVLLSSWGVESLRLAKFFFSPEDLKLLCSSSDGSGPGNALLRKVRKAVRCKAILQPLAASESVFGLTLLGRANAKSTQRLAALVFAVGRGWQS